MNRKILNILDFDKVKMMFTEYLSTQQGKDELGTLMPMDKQEKIEASFAEVQEMEQIFGVYPYFSIGRTQNVSDLTKRLELQADLNIDELLKLKRLLTVSRELVDFYEGLENVKLEHLTRLFEKLETFPQVQGALQAINDGGFIEEFASFELGKIRRKIRETEGEIRSTLQEILKTKGEMLADAIIASRNGRNVLPVKNSYRNRIAGVVHDISSSGNTVYIEPRSVIELNETLTHYHAEERYEIVRILQEISNLARPYATSIKNNAWIIGHIDLVQAKVRFMKDKKAIIPQVSSNNSIQLFNIRHPLIQNAIPNDLHFSSDLTAIVITGPNTGGKTIMLKTLGVAQLMAQSGLPILADKGSQVGVFTQIFADIGDEQSIEQSLSTFSSHMTHIVSILENLDSRSLVLLDELGSGTDPQEGAALAMAILEELRYNEIKTMATTHYPELKAYGIETKGIQNASMEFDTVTLRPTYRFMQGVPGRSSAFAIAQKLGLSKTIIEMARHQVRHDSDVNRIIEELEKQTLESRKRLDKIKEVEEENVKFNRAVKKLYNEFSREKESELEKAREEAIQIVDLAISESDSILKKLHSKSQLKPHEIIEAKGKLKNLVPEQTKLSQNKVLQKAKKAKVANVGDDIIVTNYGQRGTLVAQLKDGRWEAQVGLMKMTLENQEFELVKPNIVKQEKTTKQVNVVKKSRTKGPRARLDLRGKRYEEAIEELDSFIDQALLNNMSQVDIIHGIGTGVIREAVAGYLKRNKQVKSFGYAPQNAGGSGVTIAIFK
ncbi:Recombination inhibitory protein MutS2 [Streptococcus sp. DD10]|uniref:endonuclease MutS2 n=1 Tax=Streptococcus sp. DD10 TaxID=1777878 RepID=UPI00079B06ED|nr:endonuclease MutS2 [Streptococcus sp. DD10]KXT74560.1 Recombination inhibitory protein MutS2 [Streptococcus sp. DD10]